MSKRCPKCGSYNTERVMARYAGRAALHAGRMVLAAGATLIVGAFNPTAGHAAGHSILHNSEPDELKGYHCCKCGNDFSA